MPIHPSSRRHVMTSVLVSSLAVLVMSFGAAGHASERTLAFRDLISGSGAPSSFDVNGDGIKGHYITFAGLSNLGPVHGGMLIEYDFHNLTPDPACPAGTLKLPILASTGNRALTGTHGQLFLRDDAGSGLLCLNLTTGEFKSAVKGTFVGGLGRYAGATGTYEYTVSGNVLVADASGMPFGVFVLETAGRLTLPR